MKYLISCWVVGAALTAVPVLAAETPAPAVVRFDINRFDVEGNTLLSAEEMRSLLAPYVGKDRNFGSVQQALEALESAYHRRGYSVIQVVLPEQELNQGIVRLKVVETRIGKVTVEGNRHFDQVNIRRSLPALREGEVPNIEEISTGLRMANENPAKKNAMQLKSSDKDGEVDAIVRVDDGKPWTIGLNVDNTGNSSTGKEHIGVLFQHANLFGLDHVLSLQYTTTLQEPSRIGVYGIGYHVPLYALGDSIDLYASYSDVNSGAVTAGIFDLLISGKGSLFGARYNQNLSHGRDYQAKLTYGLDYKAFENSVVLVPSLQLGNDVTVHPFSVTYSGNWTLKQGEFNYYLGAAHNIPGGDKGNDAAFNRVRAGAPASYKLLRYGAGFNHAFSSGWQARIGLNGQYSPDALIPGEQFGAGGGGSVRGYSEREIADDSGAAVTAEMYTPNLCSNPDSWLVQCRALVFVDGAHVMRNDALPGEQTSASIYSAGLGLRLASQKNFNMQVDFGRAMKSGPATAKGDNRLHFRMNLLY